MTLIERIQNLVADGQTEKSIDELFNYVKSTDSNLLDRIILLKSRMHDLNEKVFNGTIEGDDAALQRAKINESILRILHEITPSYLKPKKASEKIHRPTVPRSTTTRKSSNKGLLTGLGILAFLVICVIFYFSSPFSTIYDSPVYDYPEYSTPEVNLEPVRFEHNAYINGNYCMKIWQPGIISNSQGKTAQVVANFMMNGQYMPARFDEVSHKNTLGYVATGNGPFTIPTDFYELGQDTMYIPYSSFNLLNTGGQTTYTIHLFTEVFIDYQSVRTTTSQPFYVKW